MYIRLLHIYLICIIYAKFAKLALKRANIGIQSALVYRYQSFFWYTYIYGLYQQFSTNEKKEQTQQISIIYQNLVLIIRHTGNYVYEGNAFNNVQL